ncbi:mycothiol synthase [Corynebacterium guangdongense]|uniref:mycothiol synthase n=1 Tax=Corynebacterium guangdongense TaxID=1783348 RepID=UPI0035B55184
MTLIWTRLPDDSDRLPGVRELLDAVSEADGIDALSEQFVLGLADARLGHQHLIGEDSAGRLVAVAAIADDEVELAVHPQQRRLGYGAQMLRSLADRVDGLKVWAHGNLPGARAIAGAENLQVVRRLLVLEIAGDSLDAAAGVDLPAGVSALNLSDSIERWGEERVLDAWLAANNEAFAWHPEQGGWDRDRLRRGMDVEWFDPADVWLLWDVPAGADAPATMPGLAGFHWTKWHDGATAEVYVVGLADGYRGRGLGGPAVSMGLRHLREGGARRVILYVEDDNATAVERYRADGFTLAEEHVVYSAS